MKQLTLSVMNFSDSKISAVIKYIYHETKFDYVQKHLNMYNKNLELSFYKNDKLLRVEDSLFFNLVDSVNFDKNTCIINDSSFIHEQLNKCDIKIYKNKHFNYIIVDEVLKLFIKNVIGYYSNYTITKKVKTYLSEIGTSDFAYNYNIDMETQLNQLKNLNSKGSGYHLLPKNVQLKGNYLYTEDMNLKIKILNNALEIDDFYYNIENELSDRNHLFITKKVNELIKPHDKKVQKKKFLSTVDMINFCFSLDLLDIKCITSINVVYYTHDKELDDKFNKVYKYKYCIKHGYDTTLSHLALLALNNKTYFSNYNIKNTKLDLDVDIILNKLYEDKYQLINKNIVLKTVVLKEEEKENYIEKFSKRYKRGYYLSTAEKYNYYLNGYYEIKAIDT